MIEKPVAEARRLIADAARVTFLTGAGISAESGVPTFRGAGGLWKSYRAEDLATPDAFRSDPRLVWEWYAWRRSLVSACEPNAAHLSIARFALRRGAGVTVVTQNVDGLHAEAAARAAAGADPTPALPLELHGSLFRDRCSRCGAVSDAGEEVDTTSSARLPRCDECGALLRPDVVWFGERLPVGVVTDAIEAARGAGVCVAVGTSALVSPAASLPMETLGAGGSLVEVNATETPLTRLARVVLRGSAASILPVLLD